MSRFSKLIDDLEGLNQQDIKNSAKVFGITATLATRLEEILNDLEDQPQKDKQSQKLLAKVNISQEELTALYGSYNNTYQAYKKAYNIKYCRGWASLLKEIQGLEPPNVEQKTSSINLEKRVEKLEKTVKTLVAILLEDKT